MRPRIVTTLVALLAALAGAQDTRPESRRASKSVLRETALFKLDVGGVKREAVVHAPPKSRYVTSPVVLAFHGHGGSAEHAAKSFAIHDCWPAAIVAYAQGLPTPIRRIDPEGKYAGWQTFVGDQKDRDFAFVDELLAALRREYRVDENRVYATGHSNGGTFTYLLWARRPDVFAAFAPSAAGSWSILTLPPKPAMHVAGRLDTLVPFENQERTMAIVRLRNGCKGPPVEWAPHCLLYPSPNGAPFVSLIHDGDHKYPSEEAPPLIVKFFKEQVRAPESRPESRKSGG